MRRSIAAVTLVVFLAAACSSADAEQRKCDQHFEDRIGHDVNDDPFWETLQQCARENRLPEGQNDPGYYAE